MTISTHLEPDVGRAARAVSEPGEAPTVCILVGGALYNGGYEGQHRADQWSYGKCAYNDCSEFRGGGRSSRQLPSSCEVKGIGS